MRISERTCPFGYEFARAALNSPCSKGFCTCGSVARRLQKHPVTEVDMGAREFQVFAEGEVGRVHVLVHRLTDESRYELGHRFLGDWLEGRKHTDSDHVHMHWHMGVFELGLGRWSAAYMRFHESILPAVDRGEAATDAPAMLWRLRLDAPRPTPLPWEVAREYALESLASEADDFIVLHDLLALAGAGDVSSMDRWLRSEAPKASTVLPQVAQGLRAFANEDYGDAAALLQASIPQLPSIGGSQAQRSLFEAIQRAAEKRGLTPS